MLEVFFGCSEAGCRAPARWRESTHQGRYVLDIRSDDVTTRTESGKVVNAAVTVRRYDYRGHARGGPAGAQYAAA